MIKEHQPTIFPDNLTVAVSSMEDGNMAFRVPGSIEEKDFADTWILQNRQRFLQKNGVKLAQTALVQVEYGPDYSYDNFRRVERQECGRSMEAPYQGVNADGLATDQTELGLFLPLADCNGLVLYDPVSHGLMLSHLGRHSTNVDGAEKSVAFMGKTFDARPENILAWIGPGVGSRSYAMEAEPSRPDHYDFVADERWRDFRNVEGDSVYIDLAGYNHNGLLRAGLLPQNIERSSVDTATDPDYPSHNQGEPSRFAVVAMMKNTYIC